MGKQRKRFWPTLLAFAIFLTQIGVTFPAPAKAAEGFVIRSDSMTVDATGIYASQTKNVTLPAAEVTNATATTDNGTVTLSRNNNQVTLTLAGGSPASFKNGSVTLTDNGNTSNSGSASTVIAGLYDVTSKTSTNGTVSTTVSGDTLTANWSGGSSYQVRVPPYTQTITTTEYQNYSHYATYATRNGCDSDGCDYTYVYYSYDSNCNLTSTTYYVTSSPGLATGAFGTITCSKPITTTKTVDVYNYESRWDYSATIDYRTATYVYNTVIHYDFKDYAPQASTLTAPQDLSDGGTITFSKPSDDYTPQNELLVSLEWQQEGSSTWNPVFTDKKITDSIFTLSGSNVNYHWDGAGVNGMVKLRLVTKDGYNQPIYSYVNGDPDTMFRMSHKPEITQVSPISGSQANTVTPKYTWNYLQDEGEGQKGFYLQVRKVGETTLSLDTGFVNSTSNEYQHPTSSPLDWGTAYEWRIQPLSETGVLGDWTGWQAFGANSIPELESVTTVSTDTLHVKTKPTPDTTGYKFYRFGTEIHDGTELEIDDTGLPSNTEQFYNVRAYNAVAQSPLSASKSAYTLAATPEFESVETTATSITVKLKQVNPQYTYHEVEYRKKGETNWLPMGSGSSLLYIQNGVEKDTTYEIRVRAFNGMTDPNGTPTDYVQTEATTKVDPPTGAVFSNITEDSFTITIDPNGNSATTKYRFWIEGVTDKTAYGTALSYTFTGLPEGNRTYTVVGQALGINSESSPIPLGTVTTKAYPIRAEDIILTAEQGKIKGSFLTGKNAAGTKYEISDSATGEVLAFSDTNTTFELSAPNPNEKHVITIRAQDKMLNVTEPVTKEIYSLANPVSSPDLTVVGPNEVKVSFDLNGNPADTEVRIQSVKGDTYDSGWITGSEAQILDLTPNTQQQYAITARNKDGVETTAITSPAKYTLANPIITAQYEPGYTNIKITLLANNPPGTMYKIINKTTGEVRDWSSDVTWDNNPLTNESENEYEALARNGDGIETVVTKLGSMKTLKALGEFVEVPRESVPTDGTFDPNTRDGKTITLDGKTVILVKGNELPLSLHDLKNIVEWKYSINDGPWSEWKSVSDNKIEQNFPVDTPGLYKLSINFKNQFGNDAGNVTKWYLADWIAPQLSTTYDKISKEANPKFGMTYSDNLDLSYGIWYQVDDQPWQSLTGNEVTGALPRDNKFKKGFVRISDVVGNVKEVPYEILSLNDQYFSIEPREGGYKVTFNVEAKTGQRYHVKTTNLVDDDFQVNESSTTNIIDVPGLTGSKYEATLGIRLPGEAFWYDPVKYPVVLGLEMPTLQSQESWTNRITLQVNPVEGALTYKIKRTDKQEEQVFTGTVFTDNDVLPARQYTYEFWAEGGQLKSKKNTITIWTKPANPALFVQKVTNSSILLYVGLNGNPENVTVEVQREGGQPTVHGLLIEETGLAEDTDYTYQVRVKSANNEYSEWIAQTIRTGDGNAEFYEKAEGVFAGVTYSTDGDKATNKAWIDVVVNDVKGLQVEGELSNGEKKILGTSATRFDNLEPNKEYRLTVVVKDEKRIVHREYTIRTPDLTPPVSGSTPEQLFDNTANDIFSEVVYQVDADDKGAWVDVSVTNTRGMNVHGTVNGVTQLLSATPVRYGDLEWDKEYLLTVVVSDGTRMKEKQYSIKTPKKGTTEEEAFRKEAAQFIQSINLVADGLINSGKAWIDVEVPQTNFAVTATIEGVSQEIKKKVRFDNLDDNAVYVVSFEVRNGKYLYRGQREITTPNRTAPEVVNIMKSGSQLQIEVLTHSELKN